MSIDMSQFYQVFFEEAGENLDSLEKMLLGMDIATADDETLNSVFRCAHSVNSRRVLPSKALRIEDSSRTTAAHVCESRWWSRS